MGSRKAKLAARPNNILPILKECVCGGGGVEGGGNSQKINHKHVSIFCLECITVVNQRIR